MCYPYKENALFTVILVLKCPIYQFWLRLSILPIGIRICHMRVYLYDKLNTLNTDTLVCTHKSQYTEHIYTIYNKAT